MPHAFHDLERHDLDPVIVVEHDTAAKDCLTLGLKSGSLRYLVQLPNAAAAELALNIASVLTRAGYDLSTLAQQYHRRREDHVKPPRSGSGKNRPDPDPGRELADLAVRLMKGLLR